MNLQEAMGDLGKSIGQKNDSRKLCNVAWKYLKYIAMAGEKSTKQLRIPLNEHD